MKRIYAGDLGRSSGEKKKENNPAQKQITVKLVKERKAVSKKCAGKRITVKQNVSTGKPINAKQNAACALKQKKKMKHERKPVSKKCAGKRITVKQNVSKKCTGKPISVKQNAACALKQKKEEYCRKKKRNFLF